MYLCFDSTAPATLPALFPTDVRSGALSVAYNFSVSLFGGTTPLIATALVQATHNLLAPGFYLAVAGLVGAVAVLFTPETARQPLPTAAPVATDVDEAHELVREQRAEQAAA
jgi:MHS family proline/betaine transporter-like MFS transporter